MTAVAFCSLNIKWQPHKSQYVLVNISEEQRFQNHNNKETTYHTSLFETTAITWQIFIKQKYIANRINFYVKMAWTRVIPFNGLVILRWRTAMTRRSDKKLQPLDLGYLFYRMNMIGKIRAHFLGSHYFHIKY